MRIGQGTKILFVNPKKEIKIHSSQQGRSEEGRVNNAMKKLNSPRMERRPAAGQILKCKRP